MFFPLCAFQFILVLHYKISNTINKMLLEKELMDMKKNLIVTLYVSTQNESIYLQQWPLFITQNLTNYGDLD